MFCSQCGHELRDEVRFCPYCGNAVSEAEQAEPSVPMQTSPKGPAANNFRKQKKLQCPACGSQRLQALSETASQTITTGGGYSGTKGCLGFLLFGPCGLLCGNCGSSQQTTVSSTNKLFWVCNNCGNKFRDAADWKKEIQQTEETMSRLVIMEAVMAAIAFLLGCLFLSMRKSNSDIRGIGTFFIISGIALGALAIAIHVIYRNKIDTETMAYENSVYKQPFPDGEDRYTKTIRATVVSANGFGGLGISVVTSYVFDCEDGVQRQLTTEKKELQNLMVGNSVILRVQGNDIQDIVLNSENKERI